MAINKKQEFGAREQEIAGFAKALAHPARIAILECLAKKNECICGELVAALPLAQSTVSQHLKELKKAGLILGEVEGPKSCYCINWKIFENFFGDFTKLFFKMRADQARCC
jgi:ArsR family transcriptional regulator, arsenate/arsenite/antimonite-responsive transcriptional repressor